MRVAVVGGGVFGQVIAWRLALGGVRVTVVEPRGPGNAGSGSGDRSRIVRALYDEPFFAEAGFVGLRLWDEWSAALGARFVEKIGVAYLVRKEGPGSAAFSEWVTKGVGHVRALGGEVIELSPEEASARWPAMGTGDLARVAFEPGGGYGRAALATRTIARASAEIGVAHVAARAIAIEESAGRAAGVRWEGQGGSSGIVEADAVIVASGFAGVSLVAPFCALPIARLAHWASYWDVPYPEGAALHQSVLPAWADLGAELYGFPDDGESGFKCATHAPRPQHHRGSTTELAGQAARHRTADSPTPDRGPDGPPAIHAPGEAADAPSHEEVEALRERVRLRFPAIASARCRSVYVCAYDSTADERFQIGPVPGVSGLWFVGAMSGHGFKHAPSLGDSVASAVLGKRPALDLSVYALRV